MVDPIGNSLTPSEQTELYTEYGEVILSLQQAFPQKSETDLHLAIQQYLRSLDNAEASKVNTDKMFNHISQKFNIEISAEAANRIKTEWEDITRNFDIDVSNLASVLMDYSSEGIDKSDRQYLILLWQMFQKELEKAVGEDGITSSQTNKELQEKQFQEYLDKTTEEMKKAGKSKFWNKLLKWVGVAAAVIGAIASCVAAVAACATGVGIAGGVCLFASATILCGLAIGGTVAAVGEEFGVDTSLGSLIGKGIARALNGLGITDFSEKEIEEFGMWTDMAIQIALTVVATALSLGAAAGPAIFKGIAKTGTTGAKIALTLGPKIIENTGRAVKAIKVASQVLNLLSSIMGIAQAGAKGVTTGINLDYQLTQAELLEIKALLEKLSTTRHMEEELLAALLSKIFEAMRKNVQDATNSSIETIQHLASLKA